MLVVGAADIPHAKISRQFFHLRPVSIVTDVDMNLFFVWIFHKSAGIYRGIKKIHRLIVGGDQHIHMGVKLLRNLYGRDFLGRVARFTPVQLKGSKDRDCLRPKKKNSADKLYSSR